MSRLPGQKRRAVVQRVLLDYGAALTGWLLFWAYRHSGAGIGYMQAWRGFQLVDALNGLLLVPLGWLFLYYLSGTYFDLYRKSRLHEVNRTLISCILGCLLISLFVFTNDEQRDYPYFIRMTGRYLLVHTSIALIARMLMLRAVKRNIVRGRVGYRTLIIGGNKKAVDIYQQIRESAVPLGNIFAGFIYSNLELANGMSAHLPQLGDLNSLEAIIDEHHIEEVILAVDSSEHYLLEQILTRLSYRPVVVKVLPDLYDIISGSVKTTNVYDVLLIHIHPDLMPDWQRVCKRMIDVMCSLAAILVLLPVYLFAAIKVKLSSAGPVFYKQERIGMHGLPFGIIKFRSMVVNAEPQGPQLSTGDDPRITPWGKVMRKWRIDELPQFLNILRGDMSLVGPRPERQHFIDLISDTQPHYRYLHKVKPGLTSWGMVQFGYAQNVDEMVARMKYDLLYIENCSLALDVKIMLYTLIVIFQGRGK